VASLLARSATRKRRAASPEFCPHPHRDCRIAGDPSVLDSARSGCAQPFRSSSHGPAVRACEHSCSWAVALVPPSARVADPDNRDVATVCSSPQAVRAAWLTIAYLQSARRPGDALAAPSSPMQSSSRTTFETQKRSPDGPRFRAQLWSDLSGPAARATQLTPRAPNAKERRTPRPRRDNRDRRSIPPGVCRAGHARVHGRLG
jgi:hypothetical protein